MSGDLSVCGSRATLGLGLGAAAGLGLLYLAYSRGLGKRTCRGKHGTLDFSNLKPSKPTVQNQAAPKEGKTQVTEDCSNIAELKKQQLEIWEQLDVILQCVRELKEEVVDLRECLTGMTDQIVGDVRSRLGQCGKSGKKKRIGFSRERSNSAESNSIYFTSSTGNKSSAETESEGGYTTANAESDNDREEAPDSMCNSSQNLDEFTQLLCIADRLHEGGDEDKTKGFKLLLDKKTKYHSKPEFCWRLARAYCDMVELAKDQIEKKSFLVNGKEEAEAGLREDNANAECHKWYAILCGKQADDETVQNRIKAGYCFKEHIDKAIELKPNDPSLYYLLGRWCYEVAQLGWIERKAAATFYGTPPSSTIDEAVKNFLKAEELKPGYSKVNSVYIAKCYRDLGSYATALHWLELASALPIKSKEDTNAESELQEMQNVLRLRS
ncbi:regulator of microtubule dynamics protein 3-like isoform X2 [Chiloscyllium plagiosum]|uniref:regulator of microtubule dynamics protein 3-like isoform X2 n=1 Tax=Chiloscyllium plagiosum TaxID=36176 RepID=UPI001CB83DA7|nr:regulator of microtubule dynamics protein 3-like isoform X2 [Chiloscyllium plagiosum]